MAMESIESANSDLTRIFAEEKGQIAAAQQPDSNKAEAKLAAESKPMAEAKAAAEARSAAVMDNKAKTDQSNPPTGREVKTAPVKTVSPIVKATQPEVKPSSPSMVGVIEIDDIGLKLPVLEGVSSQNLKIAAGHIPGTALPGQAGNSAIAAHNSYSYGRMFSRLKELNRGGKVRVKTAAGDCEYTIYEIRTVEPSDTSVLNRNAKDKVLTLITCDDEAATVWCCTGN